MDEPEYLQRLRQDRASRLAKPAAGVDPAEVLSPQEQEAVRWAKELAKGTELRSVRNLRGSRFAALLRLQGASGIKFLSLEGIGSREALVERIKPGSTVGEEVLGAYEIRGGRPVEITTDPQGQIVLKIGAPRAGANPISPERMIRQAEALAAARAKARPKGERNDRGGGGRR